jgi:alpha-tubulin suppressor-like RCC1 family protein
VLFIAISSVPTKALNKPHVSNPYNCVTPGFVLQVTDVACGKEHCLLLTEHGQVWSWGGGSRGQLGHGVLGGEERPRVVAALEGMRIRKIAAGGGDPFAAMIFKIFSPKNSSKNWRF